MSIKTNFHTHTTRCLHASGSDEEYVLKAIELGYKTLGFSDHAPYPDNRLGLRMKYNELDEYYSSINNIKKKYKNEIEILIGLEIEYDKSVYSYYEKLLEKFDYLLLGQHVTPHKGKLINNFELTNTDDYVLYAESISEALETGYFPILAHPDLVLLNPFAWDENCNKACDIIVKAAKKNNIILELNANGINRGLKEYPDGIRYPYPNKKFFEKVSKENLPVIISADAHNPNNLGAESLNIALNLAKEWNLNIVDDFRNK